RGLALILDKPARPDVALLVAHRLNRTPDERDRLGRVGDVLFMSTLSVLGRLPSQLQTGTQIKRLSRGRLACPGPLRGRPGGITAPFVRAGLERGDRRDVGLRCIVLQIASEERCENLLSKIERGVAAELDGPERAAVADHLAVMPRADD